MVHIKDASTTALASAIEHLPGSFEGLSGSRLVTAADAISAAEDASNSSLVGSFTSLMETMSAMVKIGDEIAKIHPWVNLAWAALSAGFKLVKAQQDRDSNIANLTQTMRSTYSTVLGSHSLKDDETLQDVLDRILKQTVVCGFFIREYVSRRTSAASVVKEIVSSTDASISQYQDTFHQLRDEYLGRISTYTVLVTKDIVTTVHDIRSDQLLEKLKPEDMDQIKRGICLPNTRLNAIKAILDWYSDDSNGHESVFSVFGLAGTGKSTLSTTIARMLDEIGLLGAFFFFDRQLQDRNTSKLIRTIASQLAQFDAKIGVKITQVVQDIPNIANMPLAIQFLRLLSAKALGDINWTRGPVLVVIDALDESGSEAERKDLLQVLSKGCSDLPHFLRLLIISRPERDIVAGFEIFGVRRHELGANPTAQADVQEFIRVRLLEIRQANKYLAEALRFWPSGDEIQSLAALAAGLFIWAATACRLISESHDPKERMRELIQHHPTDVDGSVLESLHSLYKTTLQSAGKWNDKSFRSDFRDIVGTIICARTPLSCAAIDSLLALPRPSSHTVSCLGSVLYGNGEEPIQILHKSFYDYLTLRDLFEPWAIDTEQYHMYVANRCLIHLEQMLHENMCSLTLPYPVRDETLPDSVAYASKYWIEHVCSVKNPPDGFCDRMDRFLNKHLLHWLEALVILKAFSVALYHLPRLLQWIQEHSPEIQVYHFAHDAHRFAQYFANTIQEHPLLVYRSALPFAPRESLIYKAFYREQLSCVVCGVEQQWSSLLQVFRGHTSGVEGIAMSPDGSQIASACFGDGTVRLWNMSSGQEALPPMRGREETSFNCVAFSPDGSRIASGCRDGIVYVWNVHTGEESLPPLLAHERGVDSVAFSPDGLQIVSASNDIRVWDGLTGQEIVPPFQDYKHSVVSVAFSPDCHIIVSGSSDFIVRLWNALTGEETLPPLRGHESTVYSVQFSPDGNRIASGSGDKTVRMWNVLTGQPAMSPLRGHTNDVWSVDFSRDGFKIVSAASREIIIWDTLTGQAANRIAGNRLTCAVFTLDACKIVAGMVNGEISVWDATVVRQNQETPQGHEAIIRCAAFSPNGTKIVSASSDGTIRVWDALIGELALAPVRCRGLECVVFSPDGSTIASASSDGTIRMWDALTGQEALPPLAIPDGRFGEIHFSPDGSKIIFHNKTEILWWEAPTGKPLPPFQSQYDEAVTIWSMAISPDRHSLRIASGLADGTVRVWDALALQEALPPFHGHGEGVISVAFTPDGTKIVSASYDKTIRLWNALTGEQILAPLLHPNVDVTFVRFSVDSLRIISGSKWTLATQVWDALTGQLLSRPLQEHSAAGSMPSLQRSHKRTYRPEEDRHVIASNAPTVTEKLVYFAEQGYFIEVNSGRHLSMIPADSFDLSDWEAIPMAVYHAGNRQTFVSWRKLTGSNYIPLINVFEV
ncbi:hypothetical protein HWV62_33954 [Athelia sp. TMB]|nr:hypothetical protein HWV62_33954 [Athelia sp. TMB]